jgi:SAM-dependent methyltransferase
VLELAAGTGQHAVHFAAGLPEVTWQPSEQDDELLEVIAARVLGAGLPNLLPPLRLDVTLPVWPVSSADGLFAANLIHVSDWSVSEALLSGAARVLKPGGLLVTYGPYRQAGAHTSVSNADFDDSLRARNPTWGVRDIVDLSHCAGPLGLELVEQLRMPANNFSLVWQRV